MVCYLVRRIDNLLTTVFGRESLVWPRPRPKSYTESYCFDWTVRTVGTRYRDRSGVLLVVGVACQVFWDKCIANYAGNSCRLKSLDEKTQWLTTETTGFLLKTPLW